MAPLLSGREGDSQLPTGSSLEALPPSCSTPQLPPLSPLPLAILMSRAVRIRAMRVELKWTVLSSATGRSIRRSLCTKPKASAVTPKHPSSSPMSQTRPTQGAPGRTLKAAARVPPPSGYLSQRSISPGGPSGGPWGALLCHQPLPLSSPARWTLELACPGGPRASPCPRVLLEAPFRSDPKEEAHKPDHSGHAAAGQRGPGHSRLGPLAPRPTPAWPRSDQMGTDHISPLRSSRQAAPR